MLGKKAALLCLAFGISLPEMIRPDVQAQVRAKDRIVATVELVQIPVLVFDDKGAVATNLKKNDFRVLEDGIEQNILYCERERLPVSFVILADVSSSMTKKIPFVQEATLALLDPLGEQGGSLDEFSVLGIETRVKMIAPFTHDTMDLERKLPLLLEPTNGSTALFDGIYYGVTSAQREAANKRRAIIVISDGGDNHSRYNLLETKRMLEEADVPVFAVMAGPSFELPPLVVLPKRSRSPTSGRPGLQVPNPPSDYIGPAERNGPHNLKTLTEASGGGVFTARQLEDLPRIVQTIGQAVRYRYVLTYKPDRPQELATARGQVADSDPTRHKIHIELFPKEKFKGYGFPYYKRSYHSIQYGEPQPSMVGPRSSN